jgi:hypothetical protein
MSFTAPLWNELVFEKINELQVAHQETMKHLSNLSLRLIHMENRISHLSSGLNVVLTYLNKEARDNFPVRPISVTPTPTPTNIASISNYNNTVSNVTSIPSMTSQTTQSTHTINTAPTILQRTQSHPPSSVFHSYASQQNIQGVSLPTSQPNGSTINHTDNQHIIFQSQYQSQSQQHIQQDVKKQTNHSASSTVDKVDTVDVQKYIDDPEEGEWTKVTKRRK